MSAVPAHEEWAELVAGRALDALEPAEDARLAAHLVGCAACRGMLDDLTHVASTLAYETDAIEPPAELIDRIREAIAAWPLDQPEATTTARELLAPVVPMRRRPTVRRVATAAAGTAVAAALALTGLYAADLHADRDRARTALAAEATVIRDMQSPTSYTVSLTTRDQASGAAVVDGQSVDLVTAGLDRNDTRTSTYVLWAVAGGVLHPVRAFDVTTAGVDVQRAVLPAGTGHATSFAVSEERGRTIPALPGQIVLGG